jgi:hypothetical protein
MQYVNAAGQPLDIEAMSRAAKKKPRPRPNDAYHKGWLAAGFPPQQLTDARLEHGRKTDAAAATDRKLLPWDEARYMRDAKPTKVRSKPYDTPAAAQAACDLAERTGWKGCSWSEVTKGNA